MLNEICMCFRNALPTSFVFYSFLFTSFSRNQLGQTRVRNVHETVLHMILPLPKLFCITPSNDCCPCLLSLSISLLNGRSFYSHVRTGPKNTKVRGLVGIRYWRWRSGSCQPHAVWLLYLTSNNYRGLPQDIGLPWHQRSPYCLRVRLEIERGTLQATAELPELNWS